MSERRSWDVCRGYLAHWERGDRLVPSGEDVIPAVGDDICYNRVGDRLIGQFRVPEVGATVRLDNAAQLGPSFKAGAARFVRVSYDPYRVQTIAGSMPSSTSYYRREA